jgi:hypothetical protein
MSIQVTQSTLGAFVPQFLLKFNDDSSLQNYFRHVLETNYEKGVVKLDVGQCQSCCFVLTHNDRPRVRPSKAMTARLHKLLAQSGTKHLGKYQAYRVKKFLHSSTLLTVRCPSCGHVNQTPIISNEGKMALKDRHLMSSEAATEVAPSVTKKKKKKRKQKEKDENCGLLIPGSKCDLDVSTAEEATSSPMEISKHSQAAPEMFSTPLNTNRDIARNWGASTPSRSADRSTPVHNYVSKGTFSTPSSRKMAGSLSDFQHRASQQKGRTSAQTNRKMKHKQLQEFLSQESTAPKKTASLADFLSSL